MRIHIKTHAIVTTCGLFLYQLYLSYLYYHIYTHHNNIRLWKQYSATGGESIEMVLVDNNVSFIQLLLIPWLVLFLFVLFALGI